MLGGGVVSGVDVDVVTVGVVIGERDVDVLLAVGGAVGADCGGCDGAVGNVGAVGGVDVVGVGVGDRVESSRIRVFLSRCRRITTHHTCLTSRDVGGACCCCWCWW